MSRNGIRSLIYRAVLLMILTWIIKILHVTGVFNG
jgi:hypothetical protein